MFGAFVLVELAAVMMAAFVDLLIAWVEQSLVLLVDWCPVPG